MFRTYLFGSGANPYITTTQEADRAFRYRCRCRGWKITACAGDVFNVNDQELIVAWYDDNGITRAGLFHSRDALNDDLVSFAVDSYDYLILRVRGKSYHDRKASLVSLATELSNLDIAGLSYGDMAEINDFFAQEARRYGLLCEFRENGVIWG